MNSRNIIGVLANDEHGIHTKRAAAIPKQAALFVWQTC